MKMDPDDIKAFPNCANLLQHIKTRVTQRVLHAFFESCTADELNGANPAHIIHVAQSAFMWGLPPTVIVTAGELRVTKLGQVTLACGFTDTYGPTPVIRIIKTWFDAFETCGESDRARNAERLTRTALHEMVHWVRDAVGADEHIRIGGFTGALEEAGHFFEMMAYGTKNICTEEEKKAAIASMRIPI